MSNKKLLMEMCLPKVEIVVGSAGITLLSPNFHIQPFLPFQQKMAKKVEVDAIIVTTGVQIYCTRMEPKFVPFDFINELPGHILIKVTKNF